MDICKHPASRNKLCRLIFFCLLSLLLSPIQAQIASLQTIALDNPLLPLVMDIRKWHVDIEFDELSHDYHRYCYHIDHCDAEWQTTDGLFESNYLEGLNDQPIDDYQKSQNTTQTYTHYNLRLPNEETSLTISGNYRVTIYDEDDEEHTPVATAEFSLVEPLMSVSGTVNSNTDIDFQRSHQQLTLAISYGDLRVNDTERELLTYVVQNRNADRRVLVHPNIKKGSGCEFNHQRPLIFPGSNEFRKFEQLGLHLAGMNVDNIRWNEPDFHVNLYEEQPVHNYSLENDANGAYIMRNGDDEENETTTEYAYVHFRLKSAPLPGGPVYVRGQWCTSWPNDSYKMEYDSKTGEYHLSVYLKLGYYNYQFVQLQKQEDGTEIAVTDRTDGNFYQTQNEYQVLVYYRQPGSRYDRLVGHKVLE